MAKVFVAAIALGAFFANPAWGAEGLPRSVDGSPIVNRWIQPGESFWLNPDHWVMVYQPYAAQIPGAPTLSVDLPSNEAPKPEPEASATENVAITAPDQVDQAPPAPDQVAPVAPAPEAPAPEPAPKKPSSRKKAATPAPAPEASPAPAPAPEAAPDPAPEAPAPEAPPAPSGAAQE